MQKESRNNLMIGVLDSIIRDPGRYAAPYFAVGSTVSGTGSAAALMTPPHNLLLTECDREFMEAVSSDIYSHGVSLPGVTAVADTADRFCDVTRQLTGRRAHLVHSMRMMVLRAVRRPSRRNCEVAAARYRELPALGRYYAEFERSIGNRAPEGAAGHAQRAVDEERAFVCRVDGVPVSMACMAFGETPCGRRIAPVYTAPEHRGQGYASLLVAHVCEMVLASGKSFCFLFSDRENSAANRVYEKVGFRAECDFNHYEFLRGGNGEE